MLLEKELDKEAAATVIKDQRALTSAIFLKNRVTTVSGYRSDAASEKPRAGPIGSWHMRCGTSTFKYHTTYHEIQW
jgi:hypothetical protein